MKELDMIKAFAELEGYKSWFGHTECVFIEVNGLVGKTCTKFNPIINESLVFKAMIKYGVSVVIESQGLATVHIDEHNRMNALFDNEIPSAIIECALKSKGLWVG